jgi:hypothetical protein
MPKPPHESSRESARPRGHKLIVMQLAATAFLFHKIARLTSSVTRCRLDASFPLINFISPDKKHLERLTSALQN